MVHIYKASTPKMNRKGAQENHQEAHRLVSPDYSPAQQKQETLCLSKAQGEQTPENGLLTSHVMA